MAAQSPPAWTRDRTLYQVNLRQFTPEGTLRAFEAHLPRLVDLGVGILWFMPIHPIGQVRRKGTLGSYYAVRDYGAVNPEHGTHRDFARMVRKCHALDLRVLLDWVPNHTAWDHPWIRQHPEWYARGEDGAIRPPVPGWTDVAQLDYGPEIGIRESYAQLPRRADRRALRGDMAGHRRLSPANRALWDAMQAAMEFWIVEHGVDGFRCDVAASLPLRFWQETRTRLRRHGDILLLAEADGPRMHERAFDATYGWTLQRGLEEVRRAWKRRRATKPGLVDRAEPGNARALQARLANDLRSYPRTALRMQMTSNHDANSWHGSVLHRLGADGAELGAVLTFVFPGIPLIYNGQEAGSRRRLAFFEKDEIPWRRHRFAALYQGLTALKRSCLLLGSGRDGAPLRFLRHDDPDVLAFVREDERGSLLAVFCLGREAGRRIPTADELRTMHRSDRTPQRRNTQVRPRTPRPGDLRIVSLTPRTLHPMRLVLRPRSLRTLPAEIPARRGRLELVIGGWEYAVWFSDRG